MGVSLGGLCVLLQFLLVFPAVLIVGKRDLGMVVNTSVSLSLDLVPASVSPVELSASVPVGFGVGLSAASASLSTVVVRWERGQTKQLIFVRSTTCSSTGTLTLSPTTSADSSFAAIVPAPSSVNLFCAYQGRVEVSLPDGLSPADLTLRDGQSVNVVFKAIRRRAGASSEGGVIPLNLPPGIQSNQNGSVLFPRFRSDQLSTELQVTIFPDATAPRTSEISFGPVLSDDPEWKGVVPLPALVLRTVHPGTITARPASLACLVGMRTTFAVSLSAASENEVTVGVTFPVGIALSTGLPSIVLPPGSVGPFFVDVTCTVATAGNIVFSPSDSLDPAFDNSQVEPRQLPIYATPPARIEVKDTSGNPLASSVRLLAGGSFSFRVLLVPASSRFVGSGGGQIRLAVSPGFVVTPSPLRFGALGGPLELVVTVNSSNTSAPGNLSFTPCVSADPQWQNLLPSLFSTLSLVPVKPASFQLRGPTQLLMGQVSTISLIPSAPPFSVVHLILAATTGYKLGFPTLQDTITIEIPPNTTTPINISLTALSQSTGMVVTTNIETEDVQYRDSILPRLNLSSVAAGSVYVRSADGTQLPLVVSILVGQTYLFSLIVDRGNGLLNSSIPGGSIPFTAPPSFSLASQPPSSSFTFEPFPPGLASRTIAFTVVAKTVLQGNVSFGPVSSSSIVWSGISPQPSTLVFDAVQPGLIAVSASALSLLTSSSASVVLRASAPPKSNVSLVLSVPSGFRVRMSSDAAGSNNTDISSSTLFSPSDVVIWFPVGVTSLTLLVQSDSTVHPFSFLSLSPVVSSDVRFNGILPSVNVITLSSTERGRLTVAFTGDRQPFPVIAGSLFNVTLSFNGSPNTGGTLIAVCPGFSFVGGGVSSYVISFVGNTTFNISLVAPNASGFGVTLTFLNISSQDAEWAGVQADIPQVSLRVVDVPTISLSDATLAVLTNQQTTFFLRVRPPPAASVAIPVSVPAGCVIPGLSDGRIVIPAEQVSLAVNFTCTNASPSPSTIRFGAAVSMDRLLNGVEITPASNISLVIYSLGKIVVTFENASQIPGMPLFPVGVVTFGLLILGNNTNNNVTASPSRSFIFATAPAGCPFQPGPGIELLSDLTADISFSSLPLASPLLISMNCTAASGAKADRNIALSFGAVRSALREWDKVVVSPPIVNFTLYSLTPIIISIDTLVLRYPDVSNLTLSAIEAPLFDVAVPVSISGPFSLGENITVITFPRSQLRVSVAIFPLKFGAAQGILLLGTPKSTDMHFDGTSVRPDSVFLLSIEDAKIFLVDATKNATMNVSQIVLRQSRNITLNFTWSQVTNITTSVKLSVGDQNFGLVPSSFVFKSGPQKWVSLPVVVTSIAPNLSTLLAVTADNSSDPQWQRASASIPLLSVGAPVFNITPSFIRVLAGNTMSVTLLSSIIPSADVWIRVTLPPFLKWIDPENNNNSKVFSLRLPAASSSATFTVLGEFPSPCTTRTTAATVTFEILSSDDHPFAGVPLTPLPAVVYRYGYARIVSPSAASALYVENVTWRREQTESLNYSLIFFDTCNRSLSAIPLPALVVASSSPMLRADSSTECENATHCRLELTLMSQVTWWNDSRSLSLSLEGIDPAWIGVPVVPSSLPVLPDFQGRGTIRIQFLTPLPFFRNATILARFLFAPVPVRPVSLIFSSLPHLQIMSTNTGNISVGQSAANIRFVADTAGDFSWPFVVLSTDTIYTDVAPFSFSVLIQETPSPTQLPSRLSRRPSRQPTNVPSFSPSHSPTHQPSRSPTLHPTPAPTILPSKSPTASPTTPSPTIFPTRFPSVVPTNLPTFFPTLFPSQSPSRVPNREPAKLTHSPTFHITERPSFIPRSLRPTFRPPSLRPTFRRTQVPTPFVAATLGPTPNPTASPSFPTSAPSRLIPTSPRPADVPRRAQLSLNLTTDANGNVDALSPSEFLDQFSTDLTEGLAATGVPVVPGQLVAVAVRNQSAGRRLLASEGVIVDLNLLPAPSPDGVSSAEVYNGLGTALNTRDKRLLEYSPLTRSINPNFFPPFVILQNCSGLGLSVACAPSSRGIELAPTSFDFYGVSPIGSLNWWKVIAIAAAIVVFLCLLLACCCCCRTKKPAEEGNQEAPSVSQKSALTPSEGLPDGSHGVQLAPLPSTKKAVSNRTLEDKQVDAIMKPPRPPIALVIKDPTDGDKWRCAKCTYDNDSGNACAICASPRGPRVPILHRAPTGPEEKKKVPKKKPKHSDDGAVVGPSPKPNSTDVFGAVDEVEWAAKPALGAGEWDGPELKQPPDEEGFEEVAEDAELVVDRPGSELPSWERLVTSGPSRPSEVPERVSLMAPPLLSRTEPGSSSSMAVDEVAVDRIGAALGDEAAVDRTGAAPGEEGAEEGDEEEEEAEDPVVRAARKQARKERRLERRAKKAAKKDERRKRKGEKPPGEIIGDPAVDAGESVEAAPSEFASEEKSVISSVVDDDQGANDDEARLARKVERKEKKKLKKETRREKKAKRAEGEGEVEVPVEPGGVIAPIPEEGEVEEPPEG